MTHDSVNHPAHYTHYKGLEVIDLTRQMDFNLGNAIKYIARAGLKDRLTEIEDLRKAVFYLRDEIAHYPVSTPEPTSRYGKIVFALTSQMNRNRGRAVELICRGSTRNLQAAVECLLAEIEWLREKTPDPLRRRLGPT